MINFWPADFTVDELKDLIAALELGLSRVPVSDFHCVFQHDLGNRLMTIVNGDPHIAELGYEYTKEYVQKQINYWAYGDQKSWIELYEFKSEKYPLENFEKEVDEVGEEAEDQLNDEVEVMLEDKPIEDYNLDDVKFSLEPDEGEQEEYTQEQFEKDLEYLRNQEKE